jgi:cellulose synthase/poly-beta-1,6-N-acetylglucosamine synthase-like glycosyltransferase
MTDTLLIALGLAYVGGLLLFLPGVLRGVSRKGKRTLTTGELPHITILVCARNEEHSISHCITSLAEQHYPQEKVELIIVNDRSTDRTAEILAEWKRKLPNLFVLETSEEDTGLHGKVNALTQGFDKATGEFVLMTDADCRIPTGWAREYVEWYNDDVGMVASITSINGGSLFDKSHCLEMLEVLALGMSGINYNVPTSIIGNNFSIRKSVYDELGGYRNIAFSVTEDLALFQAVWKSKWKVLSKANTNLAVMTDPTPSYRSWWRQKQRWVQGGKSIGVPGWIIIIVGFIGVLLLLLLPFACSVSFALTFLGLKYLGDLLILFPTLRSIRRLNILLYLPIYQLYLVFFLLCVPILYFQRDVTWKGRVYKAT